MTQGGQARRTSRARAAAAVRATRAVHPGQRRRPCRCSPAAAVACERAPSPDDDINYSVLALMMLEAHGASLSTEAVLVAGLPRRRAARLGLARAERAAYQVLADACRARVVRDGRAGAPLDIILLDGTWSETRSLARRLPPETATVALAGDATSKPSRFSCVRRRSVEQEESGRTSTLEAYILLALELGEPTEACEALDGYLGDLVDALEFGKTASVVAAARASWQIRCAESSGARSLPPMSSTSN